MHSLKAEKRLPYKMTLTKKQVSNHLSKYFLMQVATYGKHPWIASVYYAFDTELNLYFVSDATTRHCKQIKVNPKVAVAVVDTTQMPTVKSKIGLQLWAKASLATNKSTIYKTLNSSAAQKKVTSKVFSLEYLQEALKNKRLYVVSPKVIKLFDSLKYNKLNEEELVLKL